MAACYFAAVGVPLMMTGCTPSTVRPERAPIADDSAAMVPEEARRGPPRERIVNIALSQWERWGRQTVSIDREGGACVVFSPLPAPVSASVSDPASFSAGHGGEEGRESDEMENDEMDAATPDCPKFPDGTGMEATLEGCAMARNYWHIAGRDPICAQVKTGAWAWSAVFVSWVLRQAGLNQDQFLTSDAHSEYVVDARDRILPGAAFAVEPVPARPRVGDLICATRGIDTWNIDTPEKIRRRTPMHCDIVVAIGAHELKAIGGNVQQSVSMSVVELDEAGRLSSEPGADRPWLLILRNRL